MTVPRAGDFWIRREPSRRGNYTVMYILDVHQREYVRTQNIAVSHNIHGETLYDVNGSTSNWDIFLSTYRPASRSEVPNYYYGRVGQHSVMLDTEGGTSPSSVWSDSIIHNAYEYLMGNKQPKEKPQRKRKGFATFVLEKGL